MSGVTISKGIVLYYGSSNDHYYRVSIRYNKKLVSIGKFKNWIEAKKARDAFVKKHPKNSQGQWAKDNMTVNNHNILSNFRIKAKNEIRYCERCKKDLLNATHYEWCVHHVDYDNTNNSPENFELLCKSCHQNEHVVRDSYGKFA